MTTQPLPAGTPARHRVAEHKHERRSTPVAFSPAAAFMIGGLLSFAALVGLVFFWPVGLTLIAVSIGFAWYLHKTEQTRKRYVAQLALYTHYVSGSTS